MNLSRTRPLLLATVLVVGCGRLRYAPAEAGVDASLDAARAPLLDAPQPDAPLDPTLDAFIADAPLPDAPMDASFDAAMPDAPSGPCDLMAEFGPAVPVLGLAAPEFAEATMRLTDDELTGYLWSTRTGNIDLSRVTRPRRFEAFAYDEGFGELNTPAAEFEPAIARDELLLVFRATRDGMGEDLYLADRTSRAVPFTFRGRIAAVNSASNDRQPYLTDTELVFASERTGASRIYRAPRTGSVFGAATEISELASGDEFDSDPVLSADGLTLYFASTRGVADIDVLVATRPTTSSEFGAPRRLANVNTPNTDAPSWISVDQCRLYISSDRAGTPDLYVATRP